MEELKHKTDQEIWEEVELNSLTKWLMIIMVATSAIRMFSEFLTNIMWDNYWVGVYQLLGAVINLGAMILILKKNKWGAIIFIGMMLLQIPMDGLLGGDAPGTIWLSAMLRIIILSVLLVLPKNGMTGWKILFRKEEVIRQVRESLEKEEGKPEKGNQ